MKIYVASSWRNEVRQQATVLALRDASHTVYDFRDPEAAFAWKECASEEQLRDPQRFRNEVLTTPIARAGFESDMGALKNADATVLVLPCGRSAHLELGIACGMQQKTIVLLDDPMSEPELMYLACSHICVSIAEVVQVLAVETRSKRFGIWIESMPDGLIEPHWLVNDERTGDWTGTEEEAKKRQHLGVMIEREPWWLEIRKLRK